MPAEIGELSVEQYLSLAASAGRGQNNAFLQRAVVLHGAHAEAVDSARRFGRLLEGFAQRFGKDRRVCLYESPGRVNLMGMHIDHRGGVVNPVATRERIRAVCGRSGDDRIRAVSQLRGFGEGAFRLSDRLPPKRPASLGHWLDWTEKQARSFGGGRDFINYFACGPLYSACFFYPWGRQFYGADFLLDSDLPPSAGLSSSSAVVVLATDFFLRCNSGGVKPLTLDQLLDVYGHGEWYIGTRGGKGDHAAIKLCQRGAVQPVVTTPQFRALDPAPIPDGFDIILYPSGDEANKSVEPFKTSFNAPIISYQAGEMALTDYLSKRNPSAVERLMAERACLDVKHHRVYLGDVVNGALLSDAEIYRFLCCLPQVMSRDDIFCCFEGRAGSFQDGIRHAPEPEGGYRARNVTAFGLSECARGKDAGRLLAAGDLEAFAGLMNVSQLGDRVTEVAPGSSHRIKFLQDDTLMAMETQGLPICQIAGDYHVSTVNVDRMVSICLSCPGVLGARLSGAGLGGMLMVLGREGFDDALDPLLQRDYYEPLNKQFGKTHIVPSQGAGFY